MLQGKDATFQTKKAFSLTEKVLWGKFYSKIMIVSQGPKSKMAYVLFVNFTSNLECVQSTRL